MRATRFIGLSLMGVLGLSACSLPGGETPDAVAPGISGPPVSVSPSASADTGESYQLDQTAKTLELAQSKAKAQITKVIYLTFDDGPWDIYTAQMLDVLEENHAKATFFVVGNMAAQHPRLIKRIAEEGHAIGNHTWSHADLTSLSDIEVTRELTSTADAVGAAMGHCFRPPYGQKNHRVVKLAKSLGYRPIMWTTHVADWNEPPVNTMIAGMKAATKTKLNLLLHDGGGDRPNTVAAVRRMIPKWQADGYTLVSLPACRT